jgi:hypothetical protein
MFIINYEYEKNTLHIPMNISIDTRYINNYPIFIIYIFHMMKDFLLNHILISSIIFNLIILKN